MFDILLYLFENYFHSDYYPDQDTLSRRLSAAGFDQEEIDQVLDWLSGLENLAQNTYPDSFALSHSVRCFAEPELKRLNAESRGFLTFLAEAGLLNPVQRELVIDRALALNEPEVTLEQVKWIVLIVLWSQGKAQDYLFLDELIYPETPRQIH